MQPLGLVTLLICLAVRACSGNQEISLTKSTPDVQMTVIRKIQVMCDAGKYGDSGGQCKPCPAGLYKPKPGSTLCIPCPDGQTTTTTGSTDVSNCSCAAGQYDVGDGHCEPCHIAYYKPEPGPVSCIPCPTGQTTTTIGSTDVSKCHIKCDAGQYSDSEGQCKPCPITDNNSEPVCLPCPGGLITINTAGFADLSHCCCAAGQYIDSDGQCKPCPIAYYKPGPGPHSCIPCPPFQTTTTTGSTDVSKCHNI